MDEFFFWNLVKFAKIELAFSALPTYFHGESCYCVLIRSTGNCVSCPSLNFNPVQNFAKLSNIKECNITAKYMIGKERPNRYAA